MAWTTVYFGQPTGLKHTHCLVLVCIFVASRNDFHIVVDGSDELTEGDWIFTESNEQPLFPDVTTVDRERNCLVVTAAGGGTLSPNKCDLRKHHAIFCEYEGS